MGRPRKDPSAPVKQKMFDLFSTSLSGGRKLVFRLPLGGLSRAELELATAFLEAVALSPGATQMESEDDEGWRPRK